MDMNQGSIYRIFNRRQRLVLGKKSAGKSSVIMRLHLPGRQRTYLELVIFIPIKIVQKSPFLARSKNRDLPGFIGLIGPISIRKRGIQKKVLGGRFKWLYGFPGSRI